MHVRDFLRCIPCPQIKLLNLFALRQNSFVFKPLELPRIGHNALGDLFRQSTKVVKAQSSFKLEHSAPI